MTTTSSDQPSPSPDAPVAGPAGNGALVPEFVPLPLADADAQQEHDVWWGAYDGRAMLPSFLVCGLLTLGVVAGTWAWYLLFGGNAQDMRYSAYRLVGPVWLIQLARWLYRVAGLNYRLTSRHLFRTRSFFFPHTEAVPLAEVTRVTVEQTPWEGRFHLGTIRLVRDRKDLPPVLLEGVRHPERVADEIRHWVQKAGTRTANVRA